MKLKIFFIFLLALSLLAITACEKAECKTNADCIRQHYTSSCIERKCVYSPIPGECGNAICEINAGETKCSCPDDCGICAGPVSPNMELVCVRNACLESVPLEKIRPIESSAEITAGGDKLRVITNYNQPFNMLSNTFNLKFSLVTESKYNRDRRIAGIILTGQTSDKRTVTLVDKTINRNLWPGTDVEVSLAIQFPTTLKEGSLTNLELQIKYEYLTGTGAQAAQKSVIIKNPYRGITFAWVKPTTPHPCPESCDDNNPGTEDVCSASTNYFCEHRPLPNVCGNFICDAGEDRCTCAVDCGPCEGDAGLYMEYACVQSKCTAQLKPGVSLTPNSIFDDRNIGPFHLQNNYIYKNPFDVATEKFILNFNLYDKEQDVSNIKLTAFRLFEGTNEIAAVVQPLALQTIGMGSKIEITVPPQPLPEIDRSITVQVWYEYTKGNQSNKGSYGKQIGKITFLTPK
ncbi:MAG: hypothetical protein QW666_03875 [Candidatus Woesearchaeota archaeon]